MEEKRMGEIALAVLKHKLSRDGIRIGSDIKRDIGNLSKATGVPQADLKVFARILVQEAIDKAFC